jgi:hypothetical protein
MFMYVYNKEKPVQGKVPILEFIITCCTYTHILPDETCPKVLYGMYSRRLGKVGPGDFLSVNLC